MKRLLILFFLLLQIVTVNFAFSDDCFFSSSFEPLINRITITCMDLGLDTCYQVGIDVQATPGDLKLILVEVNATELNIDDLTNSALIPYYNADNETIVLPGLVVGDSSYHVELRPIFLGNYIMFDLINIVPIPSLDPICMKTSNMNNDGIGQNVVSEYVYLQGQLNKCYELKGSDEFINAMLTMLPIMVIEGVTTVERHQSPCPSGYTIGCYTVDTDGNWYAQYQYPHPLADMMIQLNCSEENGYHYIYP